LLQQHAAIAKRIDNFFGLGNGYMVLDGLGKLVR
jgi:hypothetical protein